MPAVLAFDFNDGDFYVDTAAMRSVLDRLDAGEKIVTVKAYEFSSDEFDAHFCKGDGDGMLMLPSEEDSDGLLDEEGDDSGDGS